MQFRGKSRWIGAAAGFVCALALAGPGTAATTAISPPATGEATLTQIFNHTYGGTFVQSGNNFSNGSVTATRVDDSSDQVFNANGPVTGTVLAHFAVLDEWFGYFNGASGDSFHSFVSIGAGSHGFNITGSNVSNTLAIYGPIRFSRAGTGGDVLTSKNSDNRDGLDHMVTFDITGSAITKPTKVLFFDDVISATSDRDFQDLVVQVVDENGSTAPPPVTTVAPLPAAVWPGLMLLGGYGLILLRKRRAQA